MWLKWSTTLKHMPVTRVYSCSSVTRWRQSTHVFSCTQERDGYRKGDHWPEFLSYRATPEISFRKTVTAGNTFQWHRMGKQNLLTCVTYSTCSANSICHFRGEWQLYSSWQIKWLHSEPNWNHVGDEWTLGFLTCFKRQQRFWKRLNQGLPSPSCFMITWLSF